MFLDYYQLNEQPFGALSDAAQAFQSRSHCEALNSFQDALRNDRGNLALVAESGMGKTMLLRQLLEELRQEGRAAFLFQKDCSAQQILQSVLGGLGVDSEGLDLLVVQSKLNEIWFAELLAGKRIVLLFDDAEGLDDTVLETLGQLCRYETSHSKLLQIVLCGQQELLRKLECDELAQLRKRVAKVMLLEALSPVETSAYIRHHLFVVGHRGNSLFSPDALAISAELSRGIPQNINKICCRALLEAYARGLRLVTADIVEKAERNLSTVPAARETTIELPLTLPAGTGTKRKATVRVPLFIAARTPKQFGLPGSGLCIGAVAGVLLSAGLALPHGMLKGMTHIMHGQPSVLADAVQREATRTLPSQPNLPPLNAQTRPPGPATLGLSPAVPKRNLPRVLATESANPNPRLSLTRELGLKINRIVIDPGHGGFDTGAKGPHGLLEKDLCLDVALRLGQLIEENIPSAEVVYTRKDDSHVPLEERTAIANGADADLFISIHANSSDSTEVRGVETYYLSLATSKEAKELAIRENALSQESLHDLPELVKKITSNEKIGESKLLALEIQNTLSQGLQLVSRRERNRGVKQAPFIVLTGANMPAVLSEISFVSNASDERLLLEGGQRQRIADGLYRGISAYLDGLHSEPQLKQKLVTLNRATPSSTFERATLATARNPL
jgi:N-acetylmuramoyl-L-alanine amidase/type II secretory pathway predicted ATPase ExeA